jgi:hypothetical protein
MTSYERAENMPLQTLATGETVNIKTRHNNEMPRKNSPGNQTTQVLKLERRLREQTKAHETEVAGYKAKLKQADK